MVCGGYVCELDTVHIHVLAASNHAEKLAIGNLHLLPRAVQAGTGVSDLEPPTFGCVEVVDEQYAWYVEVCVRAGYGAYPRAGRIQLC